MSDASATPAPEQPSTAHSLDEKLSVGTLSYTKAGLYTLFAWLLWGDFVFSLFESIGGPNILGLYLQNEYHITNKQGNVIFNIIPQLIGVLVGPVLSFKSDRHRGPRGRRIPFIIWTTPFLCLFAASIGYVDEIFAFAKAHVGEGGPVSPFSVAMFTISFLVVGFCFFNEFVNTVYWYLFADVVPPHHMGRFLGLFRTVGAAAGILINLFIAPHVLTHIKLIHVGIAALYFVGISMMCWRVKEGQYPLVTDVSERTTLLDKIKLYAKECFSHRVYNTVYLFTMATALLGSANMSGMFSLHLSKHQAMTQARAGSIHTVAMTPSGDMVLTGDIDGLQLWRGIREGKVEKGRALAAAGIFTAAALSPDGRFAASGFADGVIRVWGISDGRVVHQFDAHKGPVPALAVSPDGKMLASGGEDHLVKLWDLQSGQCLQTLSGHADPVRCVAFSSDSQRLASGGMDKVILIHSATDGNLLKTIEGSPGPVYTLAFAPSLTAVHLPEKPGTTGIQPIDGLLAYFYDLFRNESLYDVPADQRSRVVAPDGWLIAGGQDGGGDEMPAKVRIWDTGNGKMAMELKGHKQAIASVQYKPDLHMILSGSMGSKGRMYKDCMIRMWDPVGIDPKASDQSFSTLSGYTVGVTGLAAPDNGPQMVNGSKAGMLHLWNMDAGVSLFKGSRRAIFFGIIGLILAYPLGWLVDRFHAIRVMIVSYILMIPFPFVAYFVIHDYMSQLWIEVFRIPIGALGGAALIPMYISIFPKSTYGQMCSANGLVNQGSRLVLGFGGAAVMDWITQDTLLTDNFRYGYFWQGISYVLCLVALCSLYWQWKKLGGDRHYVPPENGAVPEKA